MTPSITSFSEAPYKPAQENSSAELLPKSRQPRADIAHYQLGNQMNPLSSHCPEGWETALHLQLLLLELPPSSSALPSLSPVQTYTVHIHSMRQRSGHRVLVPHYENSGELLEPNLPSSVLTHRVCTVAVGHLPSDFLKETSLTSLLQNVALKWQLQRWLSDWVPGEQGQKPCQSLQALVSPMSIQLLSAAGWKHHFSEAKQGLEAVHLPSRVKSLTTVWAVTGVQLSCSEVSY